MQKFHHLSGCHDIAINSIIIQTHNRNTDSVNIILSNQLFPLIVIQVLQRVANNQFIDGKQDSVNSSFCRKIRAFLRHSANMSKTSKIKELIISESRDQYLRYSGIFIYTFLALARVLK